MQIFNIEWARLETKKGVYNATETLAYRNALISLNEQGTRPLLVMHARSNPPWFNEIGGFSKPGNIRVFLDFVSYAVTHFGNLADEYITLYAPNDLAAMHGMHIKQITKRMSILAACHIEAYAIIHDMRDDMGHIETKVGYVHHTQTIEGNFLSTAIKKYLMGRMYALAALSGWFDFPLVDYSGYGPGLYADFIGLSGRDDVINCAKKLYEMLPLPVYYINEENENQHEWDESEIPVQMIVPFDILNYRRNIGKDDIK